MAPRPPVPAMVTRLAVKAEVLFGLALVTRHRAPRLAALLALAIVATAATTEPTPQATANAVVLIGAILAAIAASRLISPGPAFGAARMTVSPWWVAPAGRLLGALIAVLPVCLAAGLGLAAVAAGHVAMPRLMAVTSVYATAMAACTMAASAFLGASAAATLGFLAAFFGVAPPSEMAALLAGWPAVQHVVLWLWNLLPLPWRAQRWLAGGAWSDPSMLALWAAIGLAVAGWSLSRPNVALRAAPESA